MIEIANWIIVGVPAKKPKCQLRQNRIPNFKRTERIADLLRIRRALHFVLRRPSLYPVPGLQVQIRAARLSSVLSATDKALAVQVTVTVLDVTFTVRPGPAAAIVTFKSDSDTGTGTVSCLDSAARDSDVP